MSRARCPRRRFLVLTGCSAMFATAWMMGCGGGEKEPAATSLTVPLLGLPEGVRVNLDLGGSPVELMRTGDRVVARSLLCSHQGCEVRWEAEYGRYFCPCHDGTFDADGRVTGGPPTQPLRIYPVRVQDQMVIVGP